MDHAQVLKKYTQNVILLFDGDEAGQKAMEKSLPLLLKADLFPRVITLPKGLDPEDFLNQQGVQGLKEKIQSSRDLFLESFRKCQALAPKGPTGKLAAVQKISPIYQSIASAPLKDLYLKEMAEMLGEEVFWLRQALRSKVKISPTLKKSLVVEEKTSVPEKAEAEFCLEGIPPKAELEILNLALKFKKACEKLVAVPLEHFSHKGLRAGGG